jgi:hypothetical protein
LTEPHQFAIIKTIQEREVKDMMTLKEKVIVTLLVVAFFGICIAGNLLLDKLMVEPLMEHTEDYIYTVEATVMEHTSNGCTLLEDADGWLWMMKGQEVPVATTGTLVMDNMDTPTDKYDDEIVDFY